jgi:hypothetical protein
MVFFKEGPKTAIYINKGRPSSRFKISISFRDMGIAAPTALIRASFAANLTERKDRDPFLYA